MGHLNLFPHKIEVLYNISAFTNKVIMNQASLLLFRIESVIDSEGQEDLSLLISLVPVPEYDVKFVLLTC